MRNIKFITSFNESGRCQYGTAMLNKWKALSDFDLVVYLEDSEEKECVQADNIHYEHLPMNLVRMQDDAQNFMMSKFADQRLKHHLNGNYRFQASRFARKILAITDPAAQIGVDWLIWIDADTILTHVLNNDAMDTILRDADSCTCVYLGRMNWHHSECGFVAYNLNNGGARFLNELRHFYLTLQHYDLSEWHDSYVFDHIRGKMEEEGYKMKDLGQGIYLGEVKEKGNQALHIWPHTVLGRYFQHFKGALKKRVKV